jgi:hypothetical protein
MASFFPWPIREKFSQFFYFFALLQFRWSIFYKKTLFLPSLAQKYFKSEKSCLSKKILG